MGKPLKELALEAIKAARQRLGEQPVRELSGIELVVLRSELDYARSCVEQIEELKIKRRAPKPATEAP